MPTTTGTRYGELLNRASVNLTGTSGGSARRWGADTPTCPKCSRNVYFAEQVSALFSTALLVCKCNSDYRLRRSARRTIKDVYVVWNAKHFSIPVDFEIMMENPTVCGVTER